MLTICATCKKILKQGKPGKISHGICEPCADKQLWLEGLSVKELTAFVNRLKSKNRRVR